MTTMPRVVVHVPHASVHVPADIASAFVLSPTELEAELLAMTDRYTDVLFAMPAEEATTVAHAVSRLVVDPERFIDDADEPMAKKGMGVVYTQTSDGRPLRAAPSAEARAALVAQFYEPHHAALTKAVRMALAQHGSCLVIDAHSFPSRPLPYEDDQRADRPEICIGTDARHTPAWLRERAVVEAERLGFHVALDRPFAGALVPMAFYGRDVRVQALMIEVNRGLYMDEGTGARLPAFEAVREKLAQLVKRLVVTAA